MSVAVQQRLSQVVAECCVSGSEDKSNNNSTSGSAPPPASTPSLAPDSKQPQPQPQPQAQVQLPAAAATTKPTPYVYRAQWQWWKVSAAQSVELQSVWREAIDGSTAQQKKVSAHTTLHFSAHSVISFVVCIIKKQTKTNKTTVDSAHRSVRCVYGAAQTPVCVTVCAGAFAHRSHQARPFARYRLLLSAPLLLAVFFLLFFVLF